MLRCPVCDRRRIATQWLCRSCQDKYGDYNEWPHWLRTLVSMQRRFDRQIGGITGISEDLEIKLIPSFTQ